MAQNQADEAKRQQWFAEKHKEKTMMRLCDDTQRKIMTILEKAKYWDEEYAFVRTCGRDAQNQIRIRNARAARDKWNEQAMKQHSAVGVYMDNLKAITAARKKLQQQFGIPPTEDGYVDCGIRAELGKQFVLLDHELDSTTSVRHYMDENMGGSSLFANEEWRPRMV